MRKTIRRRGQVLNGAYFMLDLQYWKNGVRHYIETFEKAVNYYSNGSLLNIDEVKPEKVLRNIEKYYNAN